MSENKSNPRQGEPQKKCRYTGVVCTHEVCGECPIWIDFEQRQLSRDAD